MESSLHESTQQMVRPGRAVDTYYPDPDTAQKQAFRVSQNTRYVVDLASTSGGSSTITLPPNNGVQDLILMLSLPAFTSPVKVGLPRGWGYNAIRQISFRYGGSSQFFLTKQQIAQLALRKSPNGSARDDMLALGGSYCAPADLANAQSAYVWLPLPHCIPSAEGKLPPIPTDLLTQQIQITIELESPSALYFYGTSWSGTAPTAYSKASVAVQQIIFENQGDCLARREDMSVHALSFPVEFTQQEVAIPLTNVAASSAQTVTLTGFRAGECKNIQVWITADTDTSLVVPATGTIQTRNPFAWYAPENIVMTYAGEVYARYDGGSSSLWNLVNGRLSPQANDVYVTDTVITGGGAPTASADKWAELPFGQSYDPLTAHSMYMAGKPITNGIVNLAFTMPALGKTGSALTTGNYTLHISYNYNAVLMFTGGTAEYVL